MNDLASFRGWLQRRSDLFGLLILFALTRTVFAAGPAQSFTDSDGDTYSVKLAGPGAAAVMIDDPDSDTRGPIASIALTGTDATSVLSIAVVKVGDGRVNVGAIAGAGAVKTINATKCNLVGTIQLGRLESLRIGDVAAGAGLLLPAVQRDRALAFTARDVNAMQLIAPSHTLTFTARSVTGGAQISAAQIAAFNVTGGNCAADIATPGKLVSLSVKGGDFTGHIGAGKIGTFSIAKNAAGSGGSVIDSTISARKIGAVMIDRDLVRTLILAGADLGDDLVLGGTGGSADTFAAGSLRTLLAKGNVTDSIVGAGFSPVNGVFGDINDGVIGNGNLSFITSFTVKGLLDAGSLVGARKFPKKVSVNRLAFRPAANAQFVTRRAVPLTDPGDLAPPLDPTVAMPAASATAFLYTGPDAVQTGVEEGTIEPARAAVLRGRVLKRDNTPLPGVMITIFDHPEFGRTHSRADGMFDLAVNGGGLLNVSFDAVGFIPAQRQVEVFSQDFCAVPDVALLTLDPMMTPVTFGAATIQVHEATMQSDDDGQRRALLVFHPGTTAMLHQPDGSTAPLPLGSVRVTEFTVGDMGDEAMPALLPPNSAYTYCAALSVDEAANPGAAQVDFNQPVYLYVENFLNFPIGIPVPNGFFNREKGVWEAEASGLVIKILSETGGAADLDVDGDAAADTGAELTGLGITDAERQQLAARYAAGQSLWRVPLMHFSTVDANWPGGPGGGAGPPNGGPPTTPPPPDNDDDPPGFFMQSQRSFERVPVAGTPFSLNYHSNRVNGYKPANRVQIPLSGASFPGAVQRVDLEVSVGGRTFTQQFAPTTNLRTDFIWDGLDAYGRAVTGAQPATVKVSNVYPGVYSSTRTFGTNGEFLLAGNPTRRETTISTTHQVMLGNFDIRRQSLGGWTLDAHHFYDPAQRRLYLGDGSVRSIGSVNNAIGSVVGSGLPFTAGFNNDNIPAAQARLVRPAFCITADDGTLYFSDAGLFQIFRVDPDGTQRVVAGIAQSAGYNGDERPALGAQVSFAFGLALAPDGTLFFVDAGNRRVRSITPDGMIHTVAGTGVTGYTGDGGPATAARMNGGVNLMRAMDGSLFISDTNNRVIRRVGTDGIITTVVGTGVAGFSGDGGPATAAQMIEPLGTALDAEGNLYIADGTGRRIRRVGPDGIISTFAGTGGMPPSPTDPAGDGGPATAAQIGFPNGISLDREGNLLIADGIARRIRKVSRTGIITSVAGTGAAPVAGTAPNGDGGAALQAATLPTDVTVGSNGSIFFTEEATRRIRRLTPPLPGFDGTDIAVASQDGSQLYRFDESGRHLSTVGTLTGATLYTFAYDSDGQLVKLTDADGNVTTVQRTAGGTPTEIVGPFGHRTTLSVDANGSLASVQAPGLPPHTFTYDAGGLLLSETDPGGNTHSFTYDVLGRVTKADPPGPSDFDLSRVELPNGFFVTTASALGVGGKFQVEQLPTGDELRTNTNPANLVTTHLRRANAVETFATPEGMSINVAIGADPRFGLQSRIEERVTIASPGGITYTVGTSQTAGSGGIGATPLMRTVTVNGAAFTSSFDPATRTFTDTTPLGRAVTRQVDAAGRLAEEGFADFHTAKLTFNGNGLLHTLAIGEGAAARAWELTYQAGAPATLKNPLGEIERYTHDDAGRRTQRTLRDGGRIAFGFDARNRLTSVTPPGRAAHLYTYTPDSQLASYTAPDAGSGPATTTYTRNADGRLTTLTLPGGATAAFGYDAAGRLSTQTLAEGVTTFAYNAATGNLSSVQAPGDNRLALSFDGVVPVASAWTGDVVGSVSRTLDAQFRTATQSVNGAQTVALTYDADGSITAAGPLSITVDPARAFISATTLGTVADARTLSPFEEISTYSATAGGAPLLSQQFTRDLLGRVSELAESVLGTAADVFTYRYDAAGNLAEVRKNGAVQNTFTYDANGNRLAANGTAATYDAQDRLLQLGATTFTHTGNGDRLTRTTGAGTTAYSYDALGQLTAVALPGGVQIGYVIDGAGRRIGRKVNGVLGKGFLYQDIQRIVAELDGSSALVSRFVYADKDNVPAFMIRGGATYRIVSDPLGSVRLVVDTATGVVAQRLDYDAFGGVLLDTNPGFQPFGFAGGLYDPDTRLVRFGVRDYDAEAGRWTAKDPIGFAGGSANLYAYVDNDPVNGVDPSGLRQDTNPFTSGLEGNLAGNGAQLGLTGLAAAAGRVIGPRLAATRIGAAVGSLVPTIPGLGTGVGAVVGFFGGGLFSNGVGNVVNDALKCKVCKETSPPGPSPLDAPYDPNLVEFLKHEERSRNGGRTGDGEQIF